MPETNEDQPSTEVAVRQSGYAPARLQMMDRTTDSWTAVVADVALLAGKIASTDFVPKAMRGKPESVAAAILHGRELGLAPMTALAGTHVIEGKPAISAEMMRSLALQAGHEIVFDESTSARCVIRGRRVGSTDWVAVEWTIADAQRAGVAQKDVWKRYARQMLQARATTELCRMIFADVIHGMRAVEELDDGPDQVDVVTGEVTAGPATTVRRRPAARQAAQQTVQPAAPTSPERVRPALPGLPTRTAGGEGAGEAPSSPAQSAVEQPDPQGSPARPAGPPSGDGSAEPAGEEAHYPAPSPAPRQLDRAAVTRRIVMHFGRLKVEDRDERLLLTATISGRDEVQSTNDLDEEELQKVFAVLERAKDRAALDRVIEMIR